MNLKRTLLLGVTVLTTTTEMVSAGVNTYVAVSSGAWNNASTWTRVAGPDPATYPDSDDVAIITSAVTVTVATNEAASDLQVSGSGALVVNSGQVLTVTSAYINHAASSVDIDGTLILDGGTFEIGAGDVFVDAGGVFQMQGAAPILQVDVADGFRLPTSTSKLEIRSDAVISGTGSVEGGDDAAAIVINVGGGAAANLTLTIDSGMTFHGGGTFQKDGSSYAATLDNQGLIKADNSKTILVDSSLDAVTDGGTSCDVHWQAESGATMEFDISATLGTSFLIDGSFVCGGGANVVTSGTVMGSGSYSSPCLSGGCCCCS